MLVALAAWAAFAAPPLRTLIVGGGPNKSHNQVAIESNVRYVQRLLPANSEARVLFFDGDKGSQSVQCQDDGGKIYYRTPQIGQIDGPSNIEHVRLEFERLEQKTNENPSRPVLLYFTGHGSPNEASRYENNHYDLHGSTDLDVRGLAGMIRNLPQKTPITLVMVECYSGAFSNLIFENGDPNGKPTDRPLAGFFASVAERPAAGCTPEVNEANYRDFTSYFFAALSGVDRLGNPVTGADFNRDGRVTMNEAFAYTLIHDDSIDTPVCTSDTFLRRFVKTSDNEVFATSYALVLKWADPARLAVLNALSSDEHLDGDDRLALAYREFTRMDPQSEKLHDVHMVRFVRTAKSVVLAHLLETTGDNATKRRYAQLVAREESNPLR